MVASSAMAVMVAHRLWQLYRLRRLPSPSPSPPLLWRQRTLRRWVQQRQRTLRRWVQRGNGPYGGGYSGGNEPTAVVRRLRLLNYTNTTTTEDQEEKSIHPFFSTRIFPSDFHLNRPVETTFWRITNDMDYLQKISKKI